MKLDGRIDGSQDKKDVSHQKYDQPKRVPTRAARSGSGNYPIRADLKRRRSRLGPTTRNPSRHRARSRLNDELKNTERRSRNGFVLVLDGVA
jgi:hypothetical protein